jgi:hypothetical protein
MSLSKQNWSDIEPHQLGWIFNAAHDHFAEKVAELETEFARHEAFGHLPTFYTTTLVGAKNRAERCNEIVDWITRYTRILDFINAMRTACNERAAEASAEGIATFLNTPRKKKPRKTTKK